VHRLSTDGRNAAQVALQYVLHHPALTSAVVGIRTMQQLEEAVEAMNTRLTEGEVEQLRGVLKPNVYKEHR
jgi:aryl-alcohol dehydrogenase-like predicted oxidoreductase